MIQKKCLLIFVFQNLAANSIENCSVSITTLNVVSECPTNEIELSNAKKRKMCEHLANIQSCTKPNNFTYHCVFNTWTNATVEVCAPEIFSQGYCLKFDEGGARLQEIYKWGDCTKYPKPCSSRFLSSNVTHYVQCTEIITRPFLSITTTSKQLMTTNKDSMINKNDLFVTTTKPKNISVHNGNKETDKTPEVILGLLIAPNVLIVVIFVICVIYLRRKIQLKVKDHEQKGKIKNNQDNSNINIEMDQLLNDSVQDVHYGNQELISCKVNVEVEQTADNLIHESPDNRQKEQISRNLDIDQSIKDSQNGNKKMNSAQVIVRKSLDNQIQKCKDAAYDRNNFKKTLEDHSINCKDDLYKHGIDCEATFCTLEESDLEKIGVNFGQRRKCKLLAQKLQNGCKNEANVKNVD